MEIRYKRRRNIKGTAIFWRRSASATSGQSSFFKRRRHSPVWGRGTRHKGPNLLFSKGETSYWKSIIKDTF